jgi:hypothetical protein
MSMNDHTLSIDPETTLLDFNGRPQSLLDDSPPIRELVIWKLVLSERVQIATDLRSNFV